MFSRGYYSSYYYLCWWNYLFLFLEGGPVIRIICMIYLSFFLDVYEGAYVNSLLLRTGTLWNSLAVKCFLLTCDLNSFKDRFKKHFSCMGSFNLLPYRFFFFVTFLVIPSLLVDGLYCMAWIFITEISTKVIAVELFRTTTGPNRIQARQADNRTFLWNASYNNQFIQLWGNYLEW